MGPQAFPQANIALVSRPQISFGRGADIHAYLCSFHRTFFAAVVSMRYTAVKKGGGGVDQQSDRVKRMALAVCVILNGTAQTVSAIADLIRALQGYG